MLVILDFCSRRICIYIYIDTFPVWQPEPWCCSERSSWSTDHPPILPGIERKHGNFWGHSSLNTIPIHYCDNGSFLSGIPQKKRNKKEDCISYVSYLGWTLFPASAWSPNFYFLFCFSCSEFSDTNLLGFEFCNVQTPEQNQQSTASFGCPQQNTLCCKLWPGLLQNVVESYTL